MRALDPKVFKSAHLLKLLKNAQSELKHFFYSFEKINVGLLQVLILYVMQDFF